MSGCERVGIGKDAREERDFGEEAPFLVRVGFVVGRCGDVRGLAAATDGSVGLGLGREVEDVQG